MEESPHCQVHLAAALLVLLDLLVDLDRLLEASRRTIHILHLSLHHVRLPIEPVERNMEEVEHIPLSGGLDQTGLELLLVRAYPTMLVCSVSPAHSEGSTADFCLERECSERSLVRTRQFGLAPYDLFCTYSQPSATSSLTSPSC